MHREPGRTRVAGWRLLVWFGIAASAFAPLVQAIVFRQGFGSLFWILVLPVAVAGVLAWRATRGDRWAKLLLVLVSVVLVLVGTAVAVFAISFSIGQSPVIELVGWTLPGLGGVALLLGSILSLREP